MPLPLLCKRPIFAAGCDGSLTRKCRREDKPLLEGCEICGLSLIGVERKIPWWRFLAPKRNFDLVLRQSYKNFHRAREVILLYDP